MIHYFLLGVLTSIAVHDARTHIIPNLATGMLVCVGFLCAGFAPGWSVPLSQAILAAGGTLFIGLLMFQFAGFGGGDVKLFVAIAAIWGYRVLIIAMLTFFIGGVYTINQLLGKRISLKDAVPLAPSIAAAAAIVTLATM